MSSAAKQHSPLCAASAAWRTVASFLCVHCRRRSVPGTVCATCLGIYQVRVCCIKLSCAHVCVFARRHAHASTSCLSGTCVFACCSLPLLMCLPLPSWLHVQHLRDSDTPPAVCAGLCICLCALHSSFKGPRPCYSRTKILTLTLIPNLCHYPEYCPSPSLVEQLAQSKPGLLC